MPRTILENLSGRKLGVLVTILLLSQLTCFLVGLICPCPGSTQQILATVCLDHTPKNKLKPQLFFRNCASKIDLLQINSNSNIKAEDVVFVVEMPNGGHDFSRWQQSLVGVLEIHMVYKKGQKLVNLMMELTLDARLAYSDKTDQGRGDWILYKEAVTKRYMDCIFEYSSEQNKEDYPYSCTMVPLFELGSLYHDYYLLNLRLPYDAKQEINTQIGKIGDISLRLIHMNGGFTKVFVSLKTVFFPLILGTMYWFWNRVHSLARTPALLECMLIYLGASLAFLNIPLEYLTLFIDIPYMLLLSDIRQGIFYAILFSFWLVFTGEHNLLIQECEDRNSLKKYWKQLSSIAVGCVSLLIFDLWERGVHLVNPFYSIWITPLGTNLALSFVICTGLCAGTYFLFLCNMIWKVFKNIGIKRSILPSMTQTERLHYEGIMYRFRLLMGATFVCAAITVVSFFFSQYRQGEYNNTPLTETGTSLIHTGVYGMWNVYTLALLMLYAPSYKTWSELTCTEGEMGSNLFFKSYLLSKYNQRPILGGHPVHSNVVDNGQKLSSNGIYLPLPEKRVHGASEY